MAAFLLDYAFPVEKKGEPVAENHGREGVEAYWQEKNTQSLDGKDTGIL